MMNIVCVGLVGLLGIAVYVLDKVADMCEKALDQRDELRAKLKEANEMIELQREIIDEASNSIFELVCYKAGYHDEDETLETLVNNHFEMLWTKTLVMCDSDTVEDYKTNVAIKLEEKAKAMADYYDTVITKELEEQYDNVVSIYRNRR